MLSEQTQTEIITLTPTAVQTVRQLIKDRNLQGYALRVFVSGGGCSGIQYGMALESNVREQDLICEFDGIQVVVDEVSIQYLRGSTVDYIEGEKENGFRIINPNPVVSCGCSSTSKSQDCSESQRAQGGCSGCC